MSGFVMADLSEADRARLAAEARLAADLDRFRRTAACPKYLRDSGAAWDEARAAVTQ